LAECAAEDTGHAPLDMTTSSRHDLFVRGRKLTGSAMKLARTTAYHHCTLLVGSDRAAMSQALHVAMPSGTVTKTSSVGSVRSPVTTLADEVPSLGAVVAREGPGEAAQAVLERFIDFYTMRHCVGGQTGAAVDVAEEDSAATTYFDQGSRRTAAVPILVGDRVAEARTWIHRYGRTPRFTTLLSLSVAAPAIAEEASSATTQFTLEVVVFRGRVETAVVSAADDGSKPLGSVVRDAAEIMQASLPNCAVTADGLAEARAAALAAWPLYYGDSWAIIGADGAAALVDGVLQEWAAQCGW
jgi:hypothetical protein